MIDRLKRAILDGIPSPFHDPPIRDVHPNMNRPNFHLYNDMTNQRSLMGKFSILFNIHTLNTIWQVFLHGPICTRAEMVDRPVSSAKPWYNIIYYNSIKCTTYVYTIIQCSISGYIYVMYICQCPKYSLLPRSGEIIWYFYV